MVARTVPIDIQVNAQDAERGFSGVQKAMLAVQTANLGVNSGLLRISETAEQLGQPGTGRLARLAAAFTATNVAISATVGATGGIALAAAAFGRFERNLDTTRTILGATQQDFIGVEKEIRRVGATTELTASQATEGVRRLAQAGLDAGEAIVALEPAVNLAIGGLVSLEESANISTNVLMAFGLDVQELTRVTDIMGNTVSSSNVNIRELGDAIAFAGAPAKSVGVDIETATAAIGTLASAGIRASMAGRGLRGIFIDLEEEIGNSETGFIGVLRELGEQQIDLGDAVDLVGQNFGSQLLLLVDNVDAIEMLAESSRGATGRMAEMADEIGDNLVGDVKELNSAWESFSLTIGEQFNPVARGAIQLLTDLVRSANEGAEAVGDFIEYTEPTLNPLEQGRRAGSVFGALDIRDSTDEELIEEFRTLPRNLQETFINNIAPSFVREFFDAGREEELERSRLLLRFGSQLSDTLNNITEVLERDELNASDIEGFVGTARSADDRRRLLEILGLEEGTDVAGGLFSDSVSENILEELKNLNENFTEREQDILRRLQETERQRNLVDQLQQILNNTSSGASVNPTSFGVGQDQVARIVNAGFQQNRELIDSLNNFFNISDDNTEGYLEEIARQLEIAYLMGNDTVTEELVREMATALEVATDTEAQIFDNLLRQFQADIGDNIPDALENIGESLRAPFEDIRNRFEQGIILEPRSLEIAVLALFRGLGLGSTSPRNAGPFTGSGRGQFTPISGRGSIPYEDYLFGDRPQTLNDLLNYPQIERGTLEPPEGSNYIGGGTLIPQFPGFFEGDLNQSGGRDFFNGFPLRDNPLNNAQTEEFFFGEGGPTNPTGGTDYLLGLPSLDDSPIGQAFARGDTEVEFIMNPDGTLTLVTPDAPSASMTDVPDEDIRDLLIERIEELIGSGDIPEDVGEDIINDAMAGAGTQFYDDLNNMFPDRNIFEGIMSPPGSTGGYDDSGFQPIFFGQAAPGSAPLANPLLGPRFPNAPVPFNPEAMTLLSTSEESPLDGVDEDIENTTEKAEESLELLQDVGLTTGRALEGAFHDTFDNLVGLFDGTEVTFEEFTDVLTEGFKDFVDEAIQEILRLLAYEGVLFLLNSISGGTAGTITDAFGDVFSGLTGANEGGLFQVRGRPGLDRNVVSINGRPSLRVNNREYLAAIPEDQLFAGTGSGGPIINMPIVVGPNVEPERFRQIAQDEIVPQVSNQVQDMLQNSQNNDPLLNGGF